MGTTWDRMVGGDWYRPDDPELVAARARARALLDRFHAAAGDDVATRTAVLGELLGHVGRGTVVEPSLRVDYGVNVHLGDDVFCNHDCVLLDVAPITVGDHAMLGPGCLLLTPTHPLDAGQRRSGWEAAAPIDLGADVWLGGGVTVCPGVTVGAGTVVGAGAVVTRDLPAGVVAVGNPARVVRRLTSDDRVTLPDLPGRQPAVGDGRRR